MLPLQRRPITLYAPKKPYALKSRGPPTPTPQKNVVSFSASLGPCSWPAGGERTQCQVGSNKPGVSFDMRSLEQHRMCCFYLFNCIMYLFVDVFWGGGGGQKLRQRSCFCSSIICYLWAGQLLPNHFCEFLVPPCVTQTNQPVTRSWKPSFKFGCSLTRSPS